MRPTEAATSTRRQAPRCGYGTLVVSGTTARSISRRVGSGAGLRQVTTLSHLLESGVDLRTSDCFFISGRVSGCFPKKIHFRFCCAARAPKGVRKSFDCFPTEGPCPATQALPDSAIQAGAAARRMGELFVEGRWRSSWGEGSGSGRESERRGGRRALPFTPGAAARRMRAGVCLGPLRLSLWRTICGRPWVFIMGRG